MRSSRRIHVQSSRPWALTKLLNECYLCGGYCNCIMKIQFCSILVVWTKSYCYCRVQSRILEIFSVKNFPSSLRDISKLKKKVSLHYWKRVEINLRRMDLEFGRFINLRADWRRLRCDDCRRCQTISTCLLSMMILMIISKICYRFSYTTLREYVEHCLHWVNTFTNYFQLWWDYWLSFYCRKKF